MEENVGKCLQGVKALLCVPTYGNPDPGCQRDIRAAIMTAAHYGLDWAGDVSPNRMGFSAARNLAAQAAFEGGEALAHGLVWVDSDIRMRPDSIARLVDSAIHNKAEFVTGVYHQREPTHNPVFYHYNRKKKTFQPFEDYPENVFAPIEGCGFGFCWTSWKLLDAIARHPDFEPKRGWFPDDRDSGGFGEDLSFSYMAMQVGIQLYVDTSIQCGHVGEPKVVYREDFLRERAKLSKEEIIKANKPQVFGIKEVSDGTK